MRRAEGGKFPLLRSSIAAATLALVAGAGVQQPSAAAVDAVPKKPADRAVVSRSGEKTVVTISSAGGIGGATFTRKGDRWPDTLTLRLNLRGLESIKLAAGDVNLSGSHSSHGEREPAGSWANLSGGKETPLDPTSPYWTEIRAMNADGRAVSGLPPEGGWFEFAVPRALLNAQPKTFTVDWIDFHR
jgi:hypothetical protein